MAPAAMIVAGVALLLALLALLALLRRKNLMAFTMLIFGAVFSAVGGFAGWFIVSLFTGRWGSPHWPAVIVGAIWVVFFIIIPSEVKRVRQSRSHRS